MGATVIVGGRVRTLAGADAEALAFADGRIVAVGERAEVSRVAGEGAAVIDGAGLTVVPGFVDAHHHVSIAALYGGAVQLGAVTDIPALQAALAAASRALPEGRWLVAMNWDEGRLAERRPPTRAELDDAVPDRPLFALHQTCHRALANSRALALAGIDASTPEPSGGLIQRGRGGEPTGLLVERGMSRVEARARPDLATYDAAGILARMKEHYVALVRVGLTRVVDTAVPAELFTLYRELARRGTCSCRPTCVRSRPRGTSRSRGTRSTAPPRVTPRAR
ncbi:MAG: amidohydrolase family protein [Myxococcales bacterium]|nr:amidohydrolase family protein [Myxococcales bacterium]